MTSQTPMATSDIFDVLGHTWQVLCTTYGISAGLPDCSVLFEGIDLSAPDQASVGVVVNMLSEVIENVGRFSPWYKRPASDFGLSLVRDRDRFTHWELSSDAIEQWESLLVPLTVAIQKNMGFILANSVLDTLEACTSTSETCVLARCRCVPPRTIVVEYSILANASILCDACQQTFTLVPGSNDSNTWVN